MIDVENVSVWGFEHAIRGMRNPVNSWERSDSVYREYLYANDDEVFEWRAIDPPDDNNGMIYIVGANDLDLMRRLFKGGTEHRKYLRQIFVSMDIIAPIYWWKEFDTYKIGTVANSCSTMHKIASKPIELSDFSIDDVQDEDDDISLKDCFINVVADCETYRQKYLDYKKKSGLVQKNGRKRHYEAYAKKYWKALIQLLPESYNQRRTVTMNYENVFSMIRQRQGHKLDEWRTFVNVLEDLPYVKRISDDR